MHARARARWEMRCPGAGGGGTIPRSRDGVNAAGRTREDEGLSKGVFYHLSARFDRRVRGRARRAGAVDGIIGFTHARGTGVRSSGVTVSLVVRSFATRRDATRARDVRRDEPIASIAMDRVFRFDSFRPLAGVARAIASRSIDRSRPTPTWTRTEDAGGRTSLKPAIGIRTRGIGMTVHDSRMCILPKL